MENRYSLTANMFKNTDFQSQKTIHILYFGIFSSFTLPKIVSWLLNFKEKVVAPQNQVLFIFTIPFLLQSLNCPMIVSFFIFVIFIPITE